MFAPFRGSYLVLLGWVPNNPLFVSFFLGTTVGEDGVPNLADGWAKEEGILPVPLDHLVHYPNTFLWGIDALLVLPTAYK
jgi:hypothetical protein